MTSRRKTSPTPTTRAVARLSQMGRPGRVLALEADLLRTSGVRFARQHRAEDSPAVAQRLASAIATTYRRIWASAAASVGASVEPLSGSYMVIRRGTRETLVHRQLVEIDSPATIAYALDKAVSQALLSAAGLPVPESLEVDASDPDEAIRFVVGSPHPCVLKPAADTSGGTGVTCGLRTEDDLMRAWVVASRWKPRLLVERQTPGDNYRLVFLDGELIGAVRRSAPTVIGDGEASIGELIAAENERRIAAGPDDVARLIHQDLDMEITLRRQGLTLRSVIPPEQIVSVKTAVSDNGQHDNEVIHDLSEDLIAECATAVRLMRLRLAGVDLVTTDPRRSLADTGGSILEVNGTPGLHYHYQVVKQPTENPIAVPILERLLSSSGD